MALEQDEEGGLAGEPEAAGVGVGVEEELVALEGLDAAPLVAAGDLGTQAEAGLVGLRGVAPGLLADGAATEDAATGSRAGSGLAVLDLGDAAPDAVEDLVLVAELGRDAEGEGHGLGHVFAEEVT